MTIELSQAEKMAAKMFFDVTMQSAFALENPNVRLGTAFKQDTGNHPEYETLADIPQHSYEIDVEDTKLFFEVRPKDHPALSRTLIQGGKRPNLIKFLVDLMEKTASFTLEARDPARPPAGTLPPQHESGNLHYRLKIDEHLNANHDVVVMFTWGIESDHGIMMELAAWPIFKE